MDCQKHQKYKACSISTRTRSQTELLFLRRYETAVIHGQAAIREALRLRQSGFTPDLIIGHSGFGNTLYLKEVWPNAKFVGYFEWFYRSHGSDVGFGKDQTQVLTSLSTHLQQPDRHGSGSV